MKFRSVTGADVYLGLTSGHTAVVSPDGTELDKQFHKEAIAQGCLPEGVSHEEEEKTPSFDRKKVIKETLEAMLSGSDPEDFTKQGKPDLRKLNAKLGFTVERSEADAIWEEMSKAT